MTWLKVSDWIRKPGVRRLVSFAFLRRLDQTGRSRGSWETSRWCDSVEREVNNQIIFGKQRTFDF